MRRAAEIIIMNTLPRDRRLGVCRGVTRLRRINEKREMRWRRRRGCQAHERNDRFYYDERKTTGALLKYCQPSSLL